MNSTVALQADYNDLYIGAVIFAAAVIFLFVCRLMAAKIKWRKKKSVSAAAAVPEPQSTGRAGFKQTYLTKLAALEKELEQSEITSRECYQRLSSLLRSFVAEATGRDVTTRTLSEIRKMDLPELQALIEEYYEAEFGPDAEQYSAKIGESIEKTKRVIGAWN